MPFRVMLLKDKRLEHLSPGPRTTLVEGCPWCIDTLILVGCACVQTGQLLQRWHAMEGELCV